MGELLKQLTPASGTIIDALQHPRTPEQEIVASAIETLWRDYSEFAPRNVLSKFNNHFRNTYWEMYLAAGLVREGHAIEIPKNDKGPDVILMANDTRYAVEAVNLGLGDPDKPDSIPDIVSSLSSEPKTYSISLDKILFRYTQAIEEKIRQHQQWLDTGIVSEGDGLIIAIGTMADPLTLFAQTEPNLLHALFHMGPRQIHIDRQTLQQVSGPSHAFKDYGTKSSGKLVSTGYFMDASYRQISAVLSAPYTIVNNPVTGIGYDDFRHFANTCLVKNPFAAVPLSGEWFNGTQEYQAHITSSDIKIDKVR